MGIKDWFFGKSPAEGHQPEKAVEPVNPPPKNPNAPPKVKKPRKAKAPIIPTVKSEKDIATEKGEPWVSVLSVDLDADNLGNGSFNLDWNDIFVAKLVRAGFAGKTDSDIVDQWFQAVCRNILTEEYEQSMADPTNRNG